MYGRQWALARIDFRVVLILLVLMTFSILVISATTVGSSSDPLSESFFTPAARSQLQWFVIGFVVFFFCASVNYNKLRELTWLLYVFMIISLVGVFFSSATNNVHRWYRLPFIAVTIQPSEFAKLIVVITLSWFLERKKAQLHRLSTVFFAGIIVGIPFALIFKQPDLGTALVLFPITLVMFYFSGAHPLVIRVMSIMCVAAIVVVVAIFSGIVPYEDLRPYATTVLKEYQYERLNPDTFHQRAATTAIAIGGVFGNGWRKGEYLNGGWLPYAYTDSVFPAIGEIYGLFGLVLVMALFYGLVYCSFQVAIVAKDEFGRLLAAGIGIYLAIHFLINMGMMLGFLPITGVPLVLMTYGGSSVLSTMIALGILQSIYSRRFMF